MFEQITDPIFGSLVVSALTAALPLVLLFVLLGVFKMKAPKAALAALVLSVVLAIFGWRMPAGQAFSALAEGAFYGLFPILWILVNALFIFKLTEATKWFEVLGRTIRSISSDLRILAIIVAFCFGALLESLAGFGAPVAISVAMLMAAGMAPLKSAIVSLLANTAPVAFGAMAAPIIALNGVTGLPITELSAMAGRQTPFIAVLVPLILVFIVDGKRGLKQTWPIALLAGVVFGLAQFLTSNFFAVELTDVVAAVATIGAVLTALRFWQPVPMEADIRSDSPDAAVALDARRPGRAAPAGGSDSVATSAAPVIVEQEQEQEQEADGAVARPSMRDVFMAVAPYLIIMVIFSIAQIPVVKAFLTTIGSVTFRWPGLDVVSPEGEPVAAQEFKLDHLKATGTLLLLSALATMALYRISLPRAMKVYRDTLVQLKWTIVTVTAVLALSFVMNLSGQTNTLGVALASTGGFFAVLSPLIGWIGVALTGSDTASNSLFGQLQASAAQQTGLSPVLMAATNSSAGVLSKMLSLQNLAVASAAAGLVGAESTLFRKLIGWSLGLLVLITVLVVLQSGPVLGWMVP